MQMPKSTTGWMFLFITAIAGIAVLAYTDVGELRGAVAVLEERVGNEISKLDQISRQVEQVDDKVDMIYERSLTTCLALETTLDKSLDC